MSFEVGKNGGEFPPKYLKSCILNLLSSSENLKKPLAKKQCHIGPVEDCQTQKYAVEVQMKCGCVPWVLNSALGLEVNS